MSTAVVYNFADLKTNALDPNIDLIYLGADITIGSGGIGLNKNKPSLIIDGFYPLDGTGVTHTITDYSSLVQTNSIRVEGVAGGFSLTLRNCTFVGKNYYGAISTTLSTLNSGVILCLENVTYSGPQAVYHRYGAVIVNGGSYRIGVYNGTTATTNEFLEVASATLAGTINIHHDGTPDSCLWLCGSTPKLTIAENAVVKVETTGRELIYNDGGDAEILIKEGASLYMNTYHGMFYNSGMKASSITLEENAELVIDQKVRHSGVPTIHCGGNFTALSGSRLIIIRKFSASEPLIQFDATATARFDNPKSVVLYNASGRVISWNSGTGTIDINAQMIRYWLSAKALATAGGFDDIPLYHWTKADRTNATVLARVSTSATTLVSTNLIAGIDAPTIPNTTSFSVYAARVLAFGSLPLTADKVLEYSLTIKGATYPDAMIRVNVDGVLSHTQADGGGAYNAVLSTPMVKDKVVTIYANQDFKTVSIQVVSEGVVIIFYLPEALPFKRIALPVMQTLGLRKDDGWSITVRDSRNNGSEWYLYAQAPLPMSSVTAQLPDDTLIFNDFGVPSALSRQVLVYKGNGNADPAYTDTVISWPKIEGVLLSLNPSYVYEGGRYSTELLFTLSEELL